MQGEQAGHDAIGRSQQVFFHNRAQEIQDRKSGHLTDMSDCHFFEFSQFRIAETLAQPLQEQFCRRGKNLILLPDDIQSGIKRGL